MTNEEFLKALQSETDGFAKAVATDEGQWIIKGFIDIHRKISTGRYTPFQLTPKLYLEAIAQAEKGDILYCDPPYLGRYTDYYSNWTEADEQRLAAALRDTPARFILSSWHHNDYRENVAIPRYWGHFNILTKDHFYHSGAKEENRRSIVEALICNFDCSEFEGHNHGVVRKPEQLVLLEDGGEYNAR